MNLDRIREELWDMISACEDIHWYDGNEESLVNALDGNEDEAYEFKMAFSDLEAELEHLTICFCKFRRNIGFSKRCLWECIIKTDWWVLGLSVLPRDVHQGGVL